MNTKNWIAIHHSASLYTPGHLQFDAIRKYHIAKGWGNIGYHFVIEGTGAVVPGRPVDQAGAHTYQWLMNYRSLGICLAGDFDKQDPTPAQLDALKSLLTHLQLTYGIPNGKIKPHRFWATYKSCPGTLFSDLLLSSIIFSRPETRLMGAPSEPDLAPTHA